MDYRKTRIEEMPKDWDVVPLTRIAKVVTGTTPSTRNSNYWINGDVLWITPTDLSNLTSSSYLEDTERKVTNRALRECNLKVLPERSIVLSTRAPVGYVAILKKEGTINQGCKGIVFLTPESSVPEFYLYYLRRNRVLLERLSAGSTFRELSKGKLEEINVPVPPCAEQKKIAEILSTVDEAIQKVDEAIENTERLKKGLMHELFTKGIGHKDFVFNKELGYEIPMEWQVAVLNDLCERITDGSHFSPKEDKEGKYKIATVANIKDNNIDLGSCKSISETDYKALVKNGCKPEIGDVLFTKDGTVGICFTYKQNEDLVLLSSIAIIRPKGTLCSDYCSYALKSSIVFQRILGSKRGTGLKRIILQDLKRVKIPLPSISEQQKIASILSVVDEELELERERKAKLERIKTGLMNVLLTGKVRVKV